MKSRVLYSMFYSMLEQPHEVFRGPAGIAVFCAGTPLWLRLARGKSVADARLFFREFLKKYPEPLTGIISDKSTALACAEIYAAENSCSYKVREQTAFYLPPEHQPPTNGKPGELRLASASEFPLILEWIREFYAETLETEVRGQRSEVRGPKQSLLQLYIWWDSRPVAMGMLTGMGETCRLNLIYTPLSMRGKGYGGAIVSALAETVRQNGQIPVLYTASDNIAANRLYTSLGFQAAGTLTEVRFG